LQATAAEALPRPIVEDKEDREKADFTVLKQ
jgi:hypothetical protein